MICSGCYSSNFTFLRLEIMQMNQHTFVIPAYKESPYLESCINNLLAQTVKSNIIITTSTPNNHILELANKYNLPYYINEGDAKGIAADWNFAISKSITPLTTIAHQDDIYLPNFTETVLNSIISKGKDVLIAFTNYQDLIGSELRGYSLNHVVKKILLFPFMFKNKIESVFLKKFLLAFGDPIGCPTVTFNLTKLQSFSFSKKYDCILDWFAWYELAAQKGSFLYINQSLLLHRIHAGSETTNSIKNGKRKTEEKALFSLIWGKHLAKFFTALYTLGYKQNKV